MWSTLTLRPFDRLSARRITLFFLAILMALFNLAALGTAPVQAQTAPVDGMAVWSGESLNYGGITLTKSASPKNDSNLPNLAGTSCQNNPNIYYSPVGTRSNDTQYYWMDVICLSSGIDGSDKSKAIPAMLLEYRVPKGQYNPSTDKPSKFSEQRPKEIKIAPLGTDAAGNPTGNTSDKSTTSCDSTYTHGIGWIVCPVTNFLADGMDWLFGVLTNFLKVQPITSYQDNSLYRAWSIMRNLANVLFVIGFLIIIYSQITSFGLSNYGIKRLLPRLVIAAIFVNISYWLCAVAIDLSNIGGYAIEQMFHSIRNSLVIKDVSSDSWQVVKWGDVASYVLSGGGILAVGGGLAALGVIGVAGVGATIMLLLPILLGVLLSALVAILVLAARQALITILVIVSPLACVAYLLPNTEKYFERWRELFGTMLLVFPIFAVVFGGSQLAGTAIILNAHQGDANQITVILLGMAVQVAPLAITPLLIRISGNLLGRFAGIVNNPNKGLIDRTRNFTNDNYAHQKARRMGEGYTDSEGRFHYYRNNGGLRIARSLDRRKRTREGYKKAYEEALAADWVNTRAAHNIHSQEAIAELNKTRGEEAGNSHFQQLVRDDAGVRRLYFESKYNQEDAATEKKRTEGMYADVKANPNLAPAEVAADGLARRIRDNAYADKNMDSNINTSQQELNSSYYRALTADQAAGATADEIAAARDMRNIAGNRPLTGDQGPTRILNIAQEAQTKEREVQIAAADATLGREEATVAELEAITLGRVPASGRFANFPTDNNSRSAALRRLAKSAPEFAVLDVMQQLNLSVTASADPTAALIRSEFAAAINSTRKPFWLPESVRNRMAEGTLSTDYNGIAGRNRMIRETLNNFGLDANTMVSADRDDLQAVATFFGSAEAANLTPQARARIEQYFTEAFDPNGLYQGKMGKRRVELNNIRTAMRLPPIP